MNILFGVLLWCLNHCQTLLTCLAAADPTNLLQHRKYDLPLSQGRVVITLLAGEPIGVYNLQFAPTLLDVNIQRQQRNGTCNVPRMGTG